MSARTSLDKKKAIQQKNSGTHVCRALLSSTTYQETTIIQKGFFQYERKIDCDKKIDIHIGVGWLSGAREKKKKQEKHACRRHTQTRQASIIHHTHTCEQPCISQTKKKTQRYKYTNMSPPVVHAVSERHTAPPLLLARRSPEMINDECAVWWRSHPHRCPD